MTKRELQFAGVSFTIMFILAFVWPDFLQEWEVPVLLLFAFSYLIVLDKNAEEREG